ncbi:MAG: PDZ domain-containing protein [Clostridia bacterium]|nr:PDZ domain-containing protein [Clostridia bacterium]
MSRSHAGRITGLLCVLLLAACLVALLVSLRSAGSPEPKNAAEDNTFGMLLIDIPDDESAAFYHVARLGVYVLAVDEDSQAYRLGVRSGDRLSGINGSAVTSTSEAARIQSSLAADEKLEMTFHRGLDEEPLVVTFVHNPVSE